MSESKSYRTCRCGQQVVILNTRRAKKVAVNEQPKGHEHFKFRDVDRLETYYEPGQHQLHVLTCTKRGEPPATPRKKYV